MIWLHFSRFGDEIIRNCSTVGAITAQGANKFCISFNNVRLDSSYVPTNDRMHGLMSVCLSLTGRGVHVRSR